jgi:alpha-D-ribose 1-methylphosphonate 5-phosphate C-P lyase
MTDTTNYSYGFLDESSKRGLRRAILKAIALPGYQVPFGSREMPLPYGWGTGGIQVTASLLGPGDRLKVIDQGADDAVNAVSIREFFSLTATIETTFRTADATIIQTRHRIPEVPLKPGQIVVYQVPFPEPLTRLEPSRAQARKMHSLGEYGAMHVMIYENISVMGKITTSFDYPVITNNRYLMSSSPIPIFDTLKLHMSPALHLFAAGRERRVYAVPPYTDVKPLDFEDYPFRPLKAAHACDLCGSTETYLDEIVTDDSGGRTFVCSDTNWCEEIRASKADGSGTANGN